MTSTGDEVSDVGLALLCGEAGIACATIEEALRESEFVRRLQVLTSDRADDYRRAKQLFITLPPGEVCLCLLDFDVVCAYLKDESNREDYYDIRYFFEKGKTHYAFPIGTFIELVRFLEKERFFDAALVRICRNSSPDNVIANLLSENPDGFFVDVPEHAIDSTYLTLSRLFDILSSQRNQGIISTYSHELKAQFLNILRSLRTGSHAARSPRSDPTDDCDAANLAIAFESPRCDLRKDCAPSLVLLSATSVVHKAADLFTRESYSAVRTAVRPDQLTLPEMLGLAANRNVAVLKARTMANLLSGLADDLGDVLSELLPGNLHMAGATITQGSKQLKAKLSKAAKGLAEHNSGALELSRTSFLAVSMARGQLEQSAAAKYHPRQLGVLWLLDGILRRLDATKNKAYEYDVMKTDFEVQIEVRDPSSRWKEPLLRLSRYENAAGIDLWQARWRTTASLATFCECILRQVLGRGVEVNSNVEVGVDVECPLVKTSDFLRTGIVVSTTDVGVSLGMSLGTFASKIQNRLLDLSELLQLIRERSPENANETAVPRLVTQIRINLDGYSIIYNFLPTDDSFEQDVILVSRKPLQAEAIVGIHEWTSPWSVLRQSMVSVVESAIAAAAEWKGQDLGHD